MVIRIDGVAVRRELAEFPASEFGLEAVRDEMLRLSADARAFARNHYEPGHFTASAFVLDPGGTHLLLIHHRKLGLWLQPGGHLDSSDGSLLDAGLREVREETNVEDPEVVVSTFDLDVHSIPARGDTPEHLHFDVRSLLRARTPAIRGNEEVREARWFPLVLVADGRGALSGGVGTDESVRRAARRLLGAAGAY